MCVLFSVSGAHDSRSTRNTLNAASVSYVAEDWEEKKRPDIKEKEKKKALGIKFVKICRGGWEELVRGNETRIRI